MKEMTMIVLAVSAVAALGLSGVWFHFSEYWQVKAGLSDLVGAQAMDILPAVFDSLARGSFAPEFSSARVDSGAGEQKSVSPN